MLWPSKNLPLQPLPTVYLEGVQNGEKQATGPRKLRCKSKKWFQWTHASMLESASREHSREFARLKRKWGDWVLPVCCLLSVSPLQSFFMSTVAASSCSCSWYQITFFLMLAEPTPFMTTQRFPAGEQWSLLTGLSFRSVGPSSQHPNFSHYNLFSLSP